MAETAFRHKGFERKKQKQWTFRKSESERTIEKFLTNRKDKALTNYTVQQ